MEHFRSLLPTLSSRSCTCQLQAIKTSPRPVDSSSYSNVSAACDDYPPRRCVATISLVKTKGSHSLGTFQRACSTFSKTEGHSHQREDEVAYGGLRQERCYVETGESGRADGARCAGSGGKMRVT